MAKRKRIADGSNQSQSVGASSDTVSPSLFTAQRLFALAGGLIAAAMVYAGYWPADSTEVQSGAARYLAGVLIIAGGIAVSVRPLWNEPGVTWLDRIIDISACGLAVSMVMSTWINADGSNLRLGINEMWWWVAAAALLVAVRRIANCPGVATVLLHLIIAISFAVALFGWHQQWIGIPAMIEMFESDPDAMLRAAGIYADEGSSLRIVFINRLYDGGPTGTFALANSMAALLVGGLVVTIAIASRRWATMTLAQKIGWVAVIAIIGGMVIASRSRSAAGSLLIVTALALTRRLWDGRGATIAKFAAVSTAILGILAAIAWKFGSSSEWIGQAPASLEVRWRYWIASIKMVAMAPWFGVGPGQFKSRYEMFRADASTEQIADPHNWFWQIATTGGMIAAVMAILLAVSILLRYRASRSVDEVAPSIGFSPRAFYVGAGAAVVVVWIGGAVIGHLPTIDAAMLGTIGGLAALWLAIRSDEARGPVTSDGDVHSLKRIAGYAAMAMAIDLMAAGGLIVPGVAITFWVLIAIATMPPDASAKSDGLTGASASHDFRLRLGIGGATILIVGAWYLTAILPVERANAAKGQFRVAWEQGRAGEAESALRQAASADRWDGESVMQLAGVLSQITTADSQNRKRWEAALREIESEAIARMGRDAVSFRQLGDGRMLLYQRYGDETSLRIAEELFTQATTLAPAHEAYAAQLAEIYRQLGDDRAQVWAKRAVTLSSAGGYYERSLPFVLVLPALHFGESVIRGEVRRPASEVLPPILYPQRSRASGTN